VVVTNPTHVAVALRYDAARMAAPKLVAKGIGALAERIRAVARAHRVPVVENPPLARALHLAVELGAEVPPAHYRAVAEVIGFVLRSRPGR
jgi:flagellar biosynthetic protein FlhB